MELREAGKQNTHPKTSCVSLYSAAAGWDIKHWWVAVEFVLQKNFSFKDRGAGLYGQMVESHLPVCEKRHP